MAYKGITIRGVSNDKGKTRNRVLVYLKTHPSSTALEIGTALGKHRSTINRVLLYGLIDQVMRIEIGNKLWWKLIPKEMTSKLSVGQSPRITCQGVEGV